MTEAELRARIVTKCSNLGLKWHFCQDSRHCKGPRGFPDLFIAGSRPGAFLFAELKSEDGDTTPSQDDWLYMLHRAGVPYAVWRPENWDNGEIQARLKGLVA